MSEMFVTLGTWNWLIFGIILMALELVAPGVFLFWLGLAALLVGLLSFAIHLSWQAQILMFAVFAAAAVPLWRRIARGGDVASKNNRFLNKRADALVGRVSPWKSRSLTGPARCGSMTLSGGSPGPIRRLAAGSGSCRPMVPA
jgi:membrane protein implicated in regulation of membrane protease activity